MYEVMVKTMYGRTYQFDDVESYSIDEDGILIRLIDGEEYDFYRWDSYEMPYLSDRVSDYYIDKVSISEKEEF